MKRRENKVVVFADLDGTILDANYEMAEAKPTLQQLQSSSVSIVLSSSKTRFEIEFFRKQLAIGDPFIVENGSAIFVPEGYFEAPYKYSRREDGFCIIELGRKYSEVQDKLALIRKRTGASFVGFGDMNPKSIVKETGLPPKLVALAKRREYDEPLKISPKDEELVLSEVVKEGLCYTRGGRFIHVLGECDKGKAVALLRDLYVQAYAKVTTVGVGDSDNDVSMLRVVDHPFWIEKKMNRHDLRTVWLRILNFVTSLGA